MSSRNQGEFSALTRAHSPVEPNSVALAMAIKPSRAAVLDSIGIASSRLPRTTSTCPASSPAFARTFSMCGGTKWIIRSSFDGSSIKGRGAPIARGSKTLRGDFMAGLRLRLGASLSANRQAPQLAVGRSRSRVRLSARAGAGCDEAGARFASGPRLEPLDPARQRHPVVAGECQFLAD